MDPYYYRPQAWRPYKIVDSPVYIEGFRSLTVNEYMREYAVGLEYSLTEHNFKWVPYENYSTAPEHIKRQARAEIYERGVYNMWLSATPAQRQGITASIAQNLRYGTKHGIYVWLNPERARAWSDMRASRAYPRPEIRDHQVPFSNRD